LIAGVGPENFRVVDGRGNQLHNDLLAFVVERGLIGAAGLVLLGGVAFARALSLLQLSGGQDNPSRARSVVFIAAMVTITAESLTHQVFHSRELWLVLAVQEAYVMHILSGRRSIDEIHRNLVGRES
jgi:O-antigen ligase